ncbi:MAG: hypothetical protein KatS3mg002_0148 [Candidatus Woesearchaeota archaeon]|nr:MAG: hypothetical protein KatS3mg002_0148 [Candidatus Woesearchaeota archaeon]
MRLYLLYSGILLLIIMLVSCTSNTFNIDDSRQIAVNRILNDDRYIQNDGYNFKELEAKRIESNNCKDCYFFKYEFLVSREYVDFDRYIVDVVMKKDSVMNITFLEVYDIEHSKKSTNIIPIESRFDEFCENKCGDGFCNDKICHGTDCVCEENKENCPEDC